MNKQAAMNTAMIVLAYGLSGAGFAAMMMIAPLFTMIGIGVVGLVFLVRSIYNIECGRIKCEQSQEELRKFR
jgi:hypothetical protein